MEEVCKYTHVKDSMMSWYVLTADLAEAMRDQNWTVSLSVGLRYSINDPAESDQSLTPTDSYTNLCEAIEEVPEDFIIENDITNSAPLETLKFTDDGIYASLGLASLLEYV